MLVPRTVEHHTLLHIQSELEKPKGHFSLLNSQHLNRGNPSYLTLADPQEDASIALLVLVTISIYTLVSFWRQVKLIAIANGDLKDTEKITVPMPPLSLGSLEPMGGTTGAFLVLQSGGIAPDRYVPLKWQIPSELRQLAAKHGWGLQQQQACNSF